MMTSRILEKLAEIALRLPQLCDAARASRERLECAEDTACLQAVVRLNRTCPSGADPGPEFARLFHVRALKTFGPDASGMEPLVEASEKTGLFLWSHDAPQHRESLVEATRELCRSDDTISLLIDSAHRTGVGADRNPALAIIGLWATQPVASWESDTRSCLGRVGAQAERRLDEFPTDAGEEFRGWLAWYRQSAAGEGGAD